MTEGSTKEALVTDVVVTTWHVLSAATTLGHGTVAVGV